MIDHELHRPRVWRPLPLARTTAHLPGPGAGAGPPTSSDLPVDESMCLWSLRP